MKRPLTRRNLRRICKSCFALRRCWRRNSVHRLRLAYQGFSITNPVCLPLLHGKETTGRSTATARHRLRRVRYHARSRMYRPPSSTPPAGPQPIGRQPVRRRPPRNATAKGCVIEVNDNPISTGRGGQIPGHGPLPPVYGDHAQTHGSPPRATLEAEDFLPRISRHPGAPPPGYPTSPWRNRNPVCRWCLSSDGVNVGATSTIWPRKISVVRFTSSRRALGPHLDQHQVALYVRPSVRSTSLTRPPACSGAGDLLYLFVDHRRRRQVNATGGDRRWRRSGFRYCNLLGKEADHRDSAPGSFSISIEIIRRMSRSSRSC